jgi:L-alanine-DL-glutamate epimerase-like enolase superfamily enzyme
VITSALESGIGVAATLHLAATLPEQSYACGLATLDLFDEDLIVEPLDVTDGVMAVPSSRGLCVSLDRAALARVSTGATERVPR